jgi:hypothetical protein
MECARKHLANERPHGIIGTPRGIRNGLIVGPVATTGSGHAERGAALALIEPHAMSPQPVTLGADKSLPAKAGGYDRADFVMQVHDKAVTPHVAQNTGGRRSTIDDRITRHPGYAISQRIRKRVEEAFGWAKAVIDLRKMRHRGLLKVDWQFTLAMAAYNLVRLPKFARRGHPMSRHTSHAYPASVGAQFDLLQNPPATAMPIVAETRAP